MSSVKKYPPPNEKRSQLDSKNDWKSNLEKT